MVTLYIHMSLTCFLIREFVALNGIVTMADNDLTPDLETPNIFAV